MDERWLSPRKMNRKWSLMGAALVVSALAWVVTHRPHAPIWNDVYLWQRQATPAVTRAIGSSMALTHQWHILAAELDNTYEWRDSTVVPASSAQFQHPVIAVFRFDGQMTHWYTDDVLRHIEDTVTHWQQQGLQVAAIEIDHDCPTSRLADYAAFLSHLRRALGRKHALWITALPSWMASSNMEAVLSQADTVVLQVHAVQNPAFGLFNGGHAGEWLRRFAHLYHKPWYVALPAYGSRVIWGQDGHILSVESESPSLMGGANAHELMADPVEVIHFVQAIEGSPPAGFAGWVWFRLPTSEDRRAWSPQTWETVLTHRSIKVGFRVDLQIEGKGLYNVVLINTGTVDAMLPHAIDIGTSCEGAGSTTGYTLEYNMAGLQFARAGTILLPVASHITTGWLRCRSGKPDVHVEQ